MPASTLAFEVQHREPQREKLRLCFSGVRLLLPTPFAIAADAQMPVKKDPRLIPVYRAERVWNGIATSNDGRAFASYPDADGPGVKLQETGLRIEGETLPRSRLE